jgi:hypothetical protein
VNVNEKMIEEGMSERGKKEPYGRGRAMSQLIGC